MTGNTRPRGGLTTLDAADAFAVARRAVDGRDGRSVRSVSEVAGQSSERPEPGDAGKLVTKIEEFASDLCRRGVSEEKALRDAAFAVFEAAPDSLQDRVAAVAGRRWPGLWDQPGRTVRGDSTGVGVKVPDLG